MHSLHNEVLRHKHIVLCGDNLNALSIIRSLGEVGLSPIVIVSEEGHIPLVSKSKFISTIHKITSIEDCINTLLKYGDENNKPFIYTSDDNHQSEIDKRFDTLNDKFYFFNGGEAGRITSLMNKAELCDLARTCGFRIPASEIVNRGTLPRIINYPVYTKTLLPYQAGWKRDAAIYYSPEDLSKAYEAMISKQFILQEYIPKKNEFEIHGFSINGGNEIFFSYYSLYFRMSSTSFGSYKYYQISSDEELKGKIRDMIRRAKYTGIFEVEFLVDKNDELVFLEINFRIPLSNYACTYGGHNLPYLWARSVLSDSISESDASPLYDRFTFMNEVSDFTESVIGKKISLLSWLKDFRKCDCLLLFHKNDIWPGLSFLFNRCLNSIKKRLHKTLAINNCNAM